MSDLSALLALPYLLPAQAQKHVTHNEALRMLDVLVQLAVLDRTQTVPPALPAPGDRHIVAPGATGSWTGQAGRIAAFLDGQWQFFAPQPGWSAQVLAERLTLTWDGTGWQAADRLPQLGIGTDADAVNRLAVSAPATLFSHVGASHQVKVNKAAAAHTASLLFQSGWSGRAELGLAGSDTFAIKLSPDGNQWTDGLTLSPVTGLAGGSAVTQATTDSTMGRLLRVGDFGLGGSAPSFTASGNLNSATQTGFYTLSGSFENGPDGTATLTASLTVIRRAFSAGAAVTQILSRGTTAPDLWVRVGTGSVLSWSAWSRLLHGGNLLGTVSQSGGLPTGAVLERGSNANGTYLRLADGTQICTVGLTTATAAATLWTFPAAFAAAPVVTGTAVAPVLAAICLDAAPSLTSASVSTRDKTDARRADPVHLVATGRWF